MNTNFPLLTLHAWAWALSPASVQDTGLRMRRARKWATGQLRKPCIVRAPGPQSLWLPAACKEAEVINIPLLSLREGVRCRERREVVSVFSLASYRLSVENMVYNRLPAWHLRRKPGEGCLLTLSAIPGGEFSYSPPSLVFQNPLVCYSHTVDSPYSVSAYLPEIVLRI